MINFLKEIYSYREMLKTMVEKDLRTRYKGSFLGFLWTFINPLMMLVIYSLVFPYVMRVQEKNYAMFVFVALLPWIFFSTSLQISASTIIANGNLVKKIYFPRQILPISVAIGALMNYLYGLIIVFFALFIVGIKLTWLVIYLPLIIILQFLLVVGFGLIFSTVNVYFRDLEHILGILLNAWFYLTPILYPTSLFPKHLISILYMNPMTPIILATRDIMYHAKMPDLNQLLYVLVFALAQVFFGIILFKKYEKGFAEEI